MARKRTVTLDPLTIFNQGYGNTHGAHATPLQAIRRFCWDCMGGHEDPWPLADGKVEKPYRPYEEVRQCKSTSCWLHPYRTGRRPK